MSFPSPCRRRRLRRRRRSPRWRCGWSAAGPSRTATGGSGGSSDRRGGVPLPKMGATAAAATAVLLPDFSRAPVGGTRLGSLGPSRPSNALVAAAAAFESGLLGERRDPFLGGGGGRSAASRPSWKNIGNTHTRGGTVGERDPAARSGGGGEREEVETGHACCIATRAMFSRRIHFRQSFVPLFGVGVWLPLKDATQVSRGLEREREREGEGGREGERERERERENFEGPQELAADRPPLFKPVNTSTNLRRPTARSDRRDRPPSARCSSPAERRAPSASPSSASLPSLPGPTPAAPPGPRARPPPPPPPPSFFPSGPRQLSVGAAAAAAEAG